MAATLTHEYSKAFCWLKLEVRSDTWYLKCGTRSRLDFLLHTYQSHYFVSIQVFFRLSFLNCRVTILFTLLVGFWKDANEMFTVKYYIKVPLLGQSHCMFQIWVLLSVDPNCPFVLITGNCSHTPLSHGECIVRTVGPGQSVIHSQFLHRFRQCNLLLREPSHQCLYPGCLWLAFSAAKKTCQLWFKASVTSFVHSTLCRSVSGPGLAWGHPGADQPSFVVFDLENWADPGWKGIL